MRKEYVYLPVSFSVYLFEFYALVDDSCSAFCSSITRKGDPNLAMDHPPQKKRKNQKIRNVSLCFVLHHVMVDTVNHTRSQNQMLQPEIRNDTFSFQQNSVNNCCISK